MDGFCPLDESWICFEGFGGGDFGGFWGFRCCFFERVVLSCEIPAILEAALSVPEEFLRVLDLLSSAS